MFTLAGYKPLYLVCAMISAGHSIMRHYGQAMEVVQKSTVADFRTAADTASEKIILDAINRHYPDCSIYSEESGLVDRGSKFMFVVDPLDGTNNFSLGITNFTISVALVEDERVVYGAVYLPVTKELFTASESDGQAYYKRIPGVVSQRLKVNEVADLKNSTICLQNSYTSGREYIAKLSNRLRVTENCKRFMENWSPAYDYCMLAAGRIEAIISNGNDDFYDFAAGRYIAQKAGAKVTGLDGAPVGLRDPNFLVTNGTALHEKLLQCL